MLWRSRRSCPGTKIMMLMKKNANISAGVEFETEGRDPASARLISDNARPQAIAAAARALKNIFRSTPDPPASRKPRRWLMINADANTVRERNEHIDQAVPMTSRL